MSVVKSKREETELTVITKANELAKYTIQICSNEKCFPKRYRWCITSKIVESAIILTNDIIKANAIYIQTMEDLASRKKLQNDAIAETYALLNMIDIAYTSFGIEARRIENWTKLTLEVQTLLRGWRKSDNSRKFT